MLRSKDGKPIGAFCINQDVTYWRQSAAVADAILDGGELPSTRQIVSDEHFPHGIDDLARVMLAQSLSDVGVPLELMKREHKVRVVKDLQDRGLFLMRDAIGTVADLLQVSRFTIYNYLKEVEPAEEGREVRP
jgi:predicted transcriptional regulator YheO